MSDTEIWKKFTHEQLLNFTDKAFDKIYDEYLSGLTSEEKSRELSFIRLERLVNKLELDLSTKIKNINTNKNAKTN